jgi:hypothetical protein
MMQSEQFTNTGGTPFSGQDIRIRPTCRIAAAETSRATTGNYDGAFRILLDIEQLMYEANNLLNAAAVIRRVAET